MVRQALQQHHQTILIHEAASCAEAIKAIFASQFSCVILEDPLWDRSGESWFLNLRQAGITLPIVLMTDCNAEHLAVEAILMGASISFPKSGLTPQLLAHCLRSVLRFHQSQEQIKQSQEQIRRGQEELRLRDRAIAAASNGIIICDPLQPDCPIIYCNPAFSTMTGYSLDEVIGRNCRFLQGEGTEDQYVQQVRDCVRQGVDCHIVLRNYRKDGTPFWNELTLSPVRDTNGKLTHFIGVQTDISERRGAEDALRQNVARQQAVLRDMFISVTKGKLTLCALPDDLPPPLTRFADPIPLSTTGGIRDLRRHTVSACLTVGIPEGRRDDLEIAVGEAAMNAVVHSATGLGHVFTHERGTVQVRVEDEGTGITVADLPSATLRRGYSTAGTMGHGFKMILETADRVHLLTGEAGTTVVIEQDRAAAPLVW